VDDPISATYELTPQVLLDGIAAFRRWFLRPWFWVVGLITLPFVALLLLITISIALTPDAPPNARLRTAIFSGIVLIVIGFMIDSRWPRWGDRWAIRRRLRRFPEEFGLYQWVFHDEAIEVHLPQTQVKLVWAAFHEMIEDRGGFLLLIGKRSYFWIPGYTFGSAASVSRFRELARSRARRYRVLRPYLFPTKPDSPATDEL
jgi:hypothetical protein